MTADFSIGNAPTDEESCNVNIYHEEQCIICQDCPREVVLVPCGHLSLCKRCGDLVKVRNVCDVYTCLSPLILESSLGLGSGIERECVVAAAKATNEIKASELLESLSFDDFLNPPPWKKTLETKRTCNMNYIYVCVCV